MTIGRRFLAVAMLCAGTLWVKACEPTLQERIQELNVQFQQEIASTSISPCVRYFYASTFDQDLYEALVAALPRYERDTYTLTEAFVRNPMPVCTFIVKTGDLVIELCDFLEQRIVAGAPITTVAQVMDDAESRAIVERIRCLYASTAQELLCWYADIGISEEGIAESRQMTELLTKYMDRMFELVPVDAECPVDPEQMLVMVQLCKNGAVQFKNYGVMGIESLARVLGTEAGKKRVARLIESWSALYADAELGKQYFVLRNGEQEKAVEAQILELVRHDAALDAVDALVSFAVFLAARMAPDFLPSDASHSVNGSISLVISTK